MTAPRRRLDTSGVVKGWAVQRASQFLAAASLSWADIDATASYIHGRDAARWLQTRPIRSALVIWTDGTAMRIPEDSSPK
jgi:thiamine biosynthesis lipoprotein ApbE